MVINDSGNSCCHPVSTTKTLKLNTEVYQAKIETRRYMKYEYNNIMIRIQPDI